MTRLFSMKTLRYLRYRLERAAGRTADLPYKQHSELEFWREEMEKIIAWYDGRLPRFWEHASPSDEEKVTGFDAATNAVLTWAERTRRYYPDHLLVPVDYFAGMRLLDIGCGPIPHARVFERCEPYGLDQLVDLYRSLGFPLDRFEGFTYVRGGAEAMPFGDAFFDAVISVNAIDHVDDFAGAAGEVTRVLKPGGIVRLEIHYHDPTVCEPWALDDDKVRRAFGPLGVRKVAERRYADLDRETDEKGEILTVWSNRD